MKPFQLLPFFLFNTIKWCEVRDMRMTTSSQQGRLAEWAEQLQTCVLAVFPARRLLPCCGVYRSDLSLVYRIYTSELNTDSRYNWLSMSVYAEVRTSSDLSLFSGLELECIKTRNGFSNVRRAVIYFHTGDAGSVNIVSKSGSLPPRISPQILPTDIPLQS